MKQQVNELSLERAKALLGESKIDENKLRKLLERIKAFCKVSYQLYLKFNEPDKPTSIMRTLEAEPPNEFKNAA
ncbi:MAG TPA: hypothetical protein VNZ49_14225 [Bacteroidia bacterium]|jgi:hypothetical protein|nr:hypothetical protein [Bacteroidia bacterium]